MPINITAALLILWLIGSLICDICNAGAGLILENPVDAQGGIISLTVFEWHGVSTIASIFTAPIVWIRAIYNMVTFNYPILNQNGLFHYIQFFFMALGIAWVISFFVTLIRGVPSR